MAKFNSFMEGSPVLVGDNTVPGLQLTEELADLLPIIFKKVSEYGCDYFPTVVQKLRHDEMSEVAAYGGFPVRYPHWQFGMEYQKLQQGYMYGQHRIYEMVINSNPCYIYNLESNSIVDDVTVVAHALGHCDFFKNNIFFAQTNRNMVSVMANHGTRIRKYMARHGREKVAEFIDHVLRIETLIDPAAAWERKTITNPVIRDSKKYTHPKRLKIEDGHEYMDDYINPQKWIDEQKEEIQRKDAAKELGILSEPTKDVMKHLRDYAPLKPWQADILAMLYEESMYFAPQRMTKTANEGWASTIDSKIMAELGLAGLGQDDPSGGIIEYAKHKWGVLGGKYSMNPYKVGYCLFQDIEERWNKGQFGPEWDDCDNMEQRKNWDKNLGLGKEKIFEVRKYHNDLTMILEFFTQDFCEKYEFFDWKKYPNGEYKVEEAGAAGWRSVRQKLVKRHMNGGLPDIRLTDDNHKGKGFLFLEHFGDGRSLYEPYISAVMSSLCFLWKNDVYLSTIPQGKEEEIIYACKEPKEESVRIISKSQYLKE